MPATRSGCKIGFSDDVQANIPRVCAKCLTPTNKWFPWPGLWLCNSCFINTDSPTLAKLKEDSNDES
jgi:hypothetical protein